MKNDISETQEYREARALFDALRGPGSGRISDAADLNVAPDGLSAVFAGSALSTDPETPETRICSVEFASGACCVLTAGPNTDRSPKYAPDGRTIAYLSDSHRAGDFQLRLLDVSSGEIEPAPAVNGWIEYLHWSPDGQRILLAVAGHGADTAGGQGAVTSKRSETKVQRWMPTVEAEAEEFHWRSAWLFDLSTRTCLQVPTAATNLWEIAWVGNDALLAVASRSPSEGAWYEADLRLIDLENGAEKPVYRPADQLGWPCASPSGKRLAVVEAVCSDRWLVAGDLRIIDGETGDLVAVDTKGVDITYAEWRSENLLLYTGHRGLETVVGIYDAEAGNIREIWCADEVSISGRLAAVSGFGSPGDCAFIIEGFLTAPAVAVLRAGILHTSKSLGLSGDGDFSQLASVEQVRWNASDGLALEGWFLKPGGPGPFPTVMAIHGGPVHLWRPYWLARGRLSLSAFMLLRRGVAIFFPNPRGSSGRGQEFARMVKGDMGGADASDCLSGLDYLVATELSDPDRIGVTGGSYGGFMSCWLTSQAHRFAVAIPMSPVSNQVTEHLLSNIPTFVEAFLDDRLENLGGKYFTRSPVFYAKDVKAPTLVICGALDRCTPPAEARQFYSALKEYGVDAVLLEYPEEGHVFKNYQAVIDAAARVTIWFSRYLLKNEGAL